MFYIKLLESITFLKKYVQFCVDIPFQDSLEMG
jgi:hypothetical protein